MVAADLVDPSDFVWRLRAAYERASYQPESRRRWTIVPPSWWTPTLTVAERRALDPWQQDRLLRHRRAA